MIREKNILSEFPLHITGNNPDQENVSPGINQTSGYISTHGSFTEIHVEDGWLDSVNVFVWSLPKAAKLWLFVHPNFQTRFSQIMKLSISKAHLPSERASLRQPGCNWPFHHKDIFVTAAWCRTNGIPIEVVVQNPGDAVYVGPNVAHQVINVGVGFSQAVNVGGPVWRLMARNFQPCVFKGCKVEFIFTDRRYFSNVSSHKRPFHRCEEDGCEYHADIASDLAYHAKTSHGANVMSFICERCNKPFVSQSNLNKHIARVHDKTPFTFKCDICNRSLSRDNMTRHIKRCKALKAREAK